VGHLHEPRSLGFVLGLELLEGSQQPSRVRRVHALAVASLHLGASAFHVPAAMGDGLLDALSFTVFHGAPPGR
jgi:hypothetical protein